MVQFTHSTLQAAMTYLKDENFQFPSTPKAGKQKKAQGEFCLQHALCKVINEMGAGNIDAPGVTTATPENTAFQAYLEAYFPAHLMPGDRMEIDIIVCHSLDGDEAEKYAIELKYVCNGKNGNPSDPPAFFMMSSKIA